MGFPARAMARTQGYSRLGARQSEHPHAEGAESQPRAALTAERCVGGGSIREDGE